MTNREQRIVVTGLGATTPVGGTVPETWDAILAGRSGARTMRRTTGSPATSCPSPSPRRSSRRPRSRSTKVEIRRLDPSSQYALIAAREAWADAGTPEVEPERLGVAIGSGIGGVWTLLTSGTTCARRAPAGCSRSPSRC